MKKMNDINTREEFSKYLGINNKTLTFVLYIKKPENSYVRFTIPKKSGGEREIHAPTRVLKNIQKKLSKKLNEHMNYIEEENKIINKISHGFMKDKSIITNAKIHREKKYVLNIDLENFFPTLNFGRVRGFFIKNKYFELKPEIATIIAQLVCYKGSLPQGAPTSSVISNLIANIMDMKILKLTQKYHLDYTRYADDLTFSTNEKRFFNVQEGFLSELENIINQSGFKINKKKSRLQYSTSRQSVTGLVVNKKISVKKEFSKNTRAMANSLYTKGHFLIENKEGTINQLNGRFAFINQIDWYNNKDKKREYKESIPYLSLNSREKEYQKFIFYKNFINNQPLLITEGKTDVTYLKSSLKNKSIEYPNLIDKTSKNDYSYKISFFNRSKSLIKDKSKQNIYLYFLNIANHGANPINKVIDLYIGSKKNDDVFSGYWNFFKDKNVTPSNPVIIILDNDQELANFIRHNYQRIIDYKIKNNYWGEISKNKNTFRKEKEKEFYKKILKDIEKKYYTNIFENIYLITLPKNDSENVEMEDLFDIEDIVRFNKFNGDKGDILEKVREKDKARFSNYIFNNYKDVNFEQFSPVLKTLNEVIDLYNSKIKSE